MIRPLKQTVSNPTYLEFFGLTRPPFARIADPSEIFHTEQYSFLTDHLVEATTNADSLVVLCGADGSGKSTLLGTHLSGIDDNVTYVVINETCQSETQFFTELLTQIGFSDISGTLNELRNITKEFLVCRGIAGDHVLIVFDNAHLTDPRILKQLRWLCDIKIKDHRVLSVVLAGNADLVRVVDAPAMRSIKFRNHVVFSIRAYTEEETANYIWHRLRLAGGDAGVKIPQESYSRIHRYSGGIPHLINDLCHATLEAAHSLETRVVGDNIVRQIADTQQLLPHVTPLHGKGRRRTDPDYHHLQAVQDTEGATAIGVSQTDESAEAPEVSPGGVDPDLQLRQVAQLAEQVDDLRADKMRAIKDIEARDRDIIALRDELASQSMVAEELRSSLAANADEIDRQNLELANSETAFQDSEMRSKHLASELEKEILAREAAENELAEAAASIADLDQLKQKLQSTVDSRQAEVEASRPLEDELAVDKLAAANLQAELEGKTGEAESLKRELLSLRDELNSRDHEIADLEFRLEESRQECKSAEHRIAGLKDPKELQKIKDTSNRRAADLRKQTRARRTAEEELAKAKATIEELIQRKQELQLRVSDLEAECSVANERAAEFDVLDKETVNLKVDLESKADELESLRGELTLRNEVLADLETRLERSQSACELAQLRIVELKSPKEIEDIKRVSEQLAADLEKERGAREAVEAELAEAIASVDGLSQLKQEYKAKVEGLQAGLDAGLALADERAANIEALEKSNADLAAEIEAEAGDLASLQQELESKSEELADLELRLGESQQERELAERRITELASPQELEEIQRAADEIAADLEKERGAREAAEAELAEAIASVDSLGQLKQENRAKVEGLQAELNASLALAAEQAANIEALEKSNADFAAEIEGSDGKLESLRDELNSNELYVADLEARFEDSQRQNASSQLRISSLENPKELEEAKKAADQLTADFKQESRARESAENELAEASATIDELHQRQQELRATIRELNIDLGLAGERAVDVYALERRISDLKDELDNKARELDSRDQALAEVESQLAASQKECELLKGRAPGLYIDTATGSIGPETASVRDKRAQSPSMAASFERSIQNVPAYQTLREYDPGFYDGLVTKYKKLVQQGFTDEQVNDALRTEQAELIERLLPWASNGAILNYAHLIVDQLDEFQLDRIEPCLTLLVPKLSPDDDSQLVYSDNTKERELDLLNLTLKTYNRVRPLPAEEDVWPDLEPILTGLFHAFGADNVAAMQNSFDPSIDRALVCNVTRALYSGILGLPESKATKALRWLLST